MSKAKTLKKIEQDMESGNEQKRIDALLDAFDYGDTGLYLIIQALDDPSQLVREAAHLLLTENQSERAKQALWDYLPYRHLQPLCT
jgi:HEAT repeat protein